MSQHETLELLPDGVNAYNGEDVIPHPNPADAVLDPSSDDVEDLIEGIDPSEVYNLPQRIRNIGAAVLSPITDERLVRVIDSLPYSEISEESSDSELIAALHATARRLAAEDREDDARTDRRFR